MNTGLVWEKKSDDGTIHDQDTRYTWDNAFRGHVASLNTICANDESVTCSANADCVAAGVGRKCGFAGKRDWRVPNVKELPSIINYQKFDPAVSGAFNTNCVPNATVLDGSCTGASFYWSSTTFADGPEGALDVDFRSGVSVSVSGKDAGLLVRAVRGGSL